ncbi:hypothetical protein J7K18_02150 [bacterium]|nr:hypothetical protein [bacterium]
MKGTSKQVVLTILLIIYLLAVALSGLLFTLQETFNPHLELPLQVVIELFFYAVTLYFFLGRFEIIKFFKGLGIIIITRIVLSLGVGVAICVVGDLRYIDALREALYGYFLAYLFQILVTPFLSYPVLGMLTIRSEAKPPVGEPKPEVPPAVPGVEPDEEILQSAWIPLEEEKEVVEVKEEQKPGEVEEAVEETVEKIKEVPTAPEMVEKEEEVALEESASIWSEEITEAVEAAEAEEIAPKPEKPEVEEVPVKSAPKFIRLSLRQIFDLNKDNPGIEVLKKLVKGGFDYNLSIPFGLIASQIETGEIKLTADAIYDVIPIEYVNFVSPEQSANLSEIELLLPLDAIVQQIPPQYFEDVIKTEEPVRSKWEEEAEKELADTVLFSEEKELAEGIKIEKKDEGGIKVERIQEEVEEEEAEKKEPAVEEEKEPEPVLDMEEAQLDQIPQEEESEQPLEQPEEQIELEFNLPSVEGAIETGEEEYEPFPKVAPSEAAEGVEFSLEELEEEKPPSAPVTGIARKEISVDFSRVFEQLKHYGGKFKIDFLTAQPHRLFGVIHTPEVEPAEVAGVVNRIFEGFLIPGWEKSINFLTQVYQNGISVITFPLAPQTSSALIFINPYEQRPGIVEKDMGKIGEIVAELIVDELQMTSIEVSQPDTEGLVIRDWEAERLLEQTSGLGFTLSKSVTSAEQELLILADTEEAVKETAYIGLALSPLFVKLSERIRLGNLICAMLWNSQDNIFYAPAGANRLFMARTRKRVIKSEFLFRLGNIAKQLEQQKSDE